MTRKKYTRNNISAKFAKQIENINKDIDRETGLAISALINEYHDVFVTSDDPLPAVTDVEHSITLKTDEPIVTPLYKHPIIMQAEIEKQIDKFYKQGLIRDSHSPYQSNFWLVPRKEDASKEKRYHLVMDFRKINSLTEQDNYPLPFIEEIRSLLGSAKYTSAFDMANGFHAVKVKASDVKNCIQHL